MEAYNQHVSKGLFVPSKKLVDAHLACLGLDRLQEGELADAQWWSASALHNAIVGLCGTLQAAVSHRQDCLPVPLVRRGALCWEIRQALFVRLVVGTEKLQLFLAAMAAELIEQAPRLSGPGWRLQVTDGSDVNLHADAATARHRSGPSRLRARAVRLDLSGQGRLSPKQDHA